MSNDIVVVLGCFGLVTNGFVSCAGVENPILRINVSIQHYNEMMDYFDSCRLFDRPMFEQQAIRHFIFNMRDRFDQTAVGRRLWAEKQFELYQKFLIDHRLCGLYVKLLLVDNSTEIKVEEPEEKKFLIKSPESNDFVSNTKKGLTLIRGRK